MKRRRIVFVCVLLGASMIASPAGARTWGVFVGLSKPTDEHVNIGFHCAGEYFRDQRPHIALGIEGAFDRWSGSSEPGVVGVDWHTSGAAYLFEVTPSVRLTTAESEHDSRQFFLQVGVGATFISSNMEVMVTPVVPNPSEWVGIDLDSQVAPSLATGIGWRSRSGDALGSIDLKFHALFTEPEATNYLAVSVGAAF